MESFETTLTGSDGTVDGIVTPVNHASFKDIYQFTSLDSSLHLTIAKDYTGKWIRVTGSEPYFSGWVDELSEHIAAYHTATKTKHAVAEVKPTPSKTTATSTAKKTAATTAPEKSKITVKKTDVTIETAKKTPLSKKAKVTSTAKNNL
jgi:hypothetical protein